MSQWIPSHSGVKGNKKADLIAKTNANQEQANNFVSVNQHRVSHQNPLVSAHMKVLASDWWPMIRLQAAYARQNAPKETGRFFLPFFSPLGVQNY